MANHPCDHWQMDLIDFSAQSALNNGHRYILTVMDCFSKFAWATPIKTKHAGSVAKALREILDDPIVGERVPKILQSDNGSEFKEQVSELLERRGIKQLFSAPYKPTTQGLIERFNGTLKRAVFEHMSQYNTKKWNDVLPEIVRGYNASRHSATGVAPMALMDPAVRTDLLDAARARIHAAARKRLGQSSARFAPIHVGDTVRISARTEAEVRRMELLGQSKGKHPNWSKELYVVTHVSEPAADALTLPSYRVESSDGDPIPQRFYRNDLQKIDPDALMVNEAARPDYSHGAIFNQEAHLRRIQTTRQSRAAEQRPQRKSRSPALSSPRPARRRRSRRGRPAKDRQDQGDQPLYEVAEIMEQKQHNRHPIFRVRWEGYPAEADWTWEPLEHIKDTEAFATWRRERNKRQRRA
jgi:hypothetical protein